MLNSLTIRQFQPRDADAVITLWQDSLPSAQPWNEPVQAICRKRNNSAELFFVSEFQNRVVGTVVVGYDGTRGWIYSLAVDAEYRRQGIGRRLLAEAERALRARGCPKVNLQVRGSNREVTRFYESSGYEFEDRASLGKPLLPVGDAIADPVPSIQVNDGVRLAQITVDDKPAYLNYLNDSDTFYRNMMLIPFPYTELDADQWISKVGCETLELDRCRNWAIRDGAGALIGGIGLCGLALNETAEVGYWLAKPYWGQGITTAAVRAVCDFAFEHYGCRRIFAKVFHTNPASARVLAKAGFEQEGTLRSHHFRDGEPHDVLLFGLLRA